MFIEAKRLNRNSYCQNQNFISHTEHPKASQNQAAHIQPVKATPKVYSRGDRNPKRFRGCAFFTQVFTFSPAFSARLEILSEISMCFENTLVNYLIAPIQTGRISRRVHMGGSFACIWLFKHTIQKGSRLFPIPLVTWLHPIDRSHPS